jgi:hypothetical protein
VTREIPLTRGLVSLVDDADYDRVTAAGSWQAKKGRSTYYARRSSVPLHRFLTGWQMTDHINGDGLDNRRTNLRPATPAQNQANRRRNANSRSGFKGVDLLPSGRWRAQISVNGVKAHIGSFPTPQDAARAYDAAARAAHGDYAWLNFPTRARMSA